MQKIMTPGDAEAAGWKRCRIAGFMECIGPLWKKKNETGYSYGAFVEDRHLNAAGITHGGFLQSIMDQVVSIHAWEAFARNACVTVQMNTNFLQSVRTDDFVVADCHIIQKSSSLIFIEGGLAVEDRQVLFVSAILKLVR